MGGGPQQFTEVAQRMTADDLPVINCLQKEAVALLDADVEVIRPELAHDSIELPAAVDLADQGRLAQLVRDGESIDIVEDPVTKTRQHVGWQVECSETAKPEGGAGGI